MHPYYWILITVLGSVVLRHDKPYIAIVAQDTSLTRVVVRTETTEEVWEIEVL